MVESLSAFPFTKLRYHPLNIVDVMMHLKHFDACKFMFTVNREMRTFLKDNIDIIQNGFINDGLIVYDFKNDYNSYQELERLYFQALKR